MITRDIAIKINELKYELMSYLQNLYKDDPIKGAVVSHIIEDESLSDQLTSQLTIKVKELIELEDFFIYQLATGAKPYKDGTSAQKAGFIISDIEQNKKLEEVKK